MSTPPIQSLTPLPKKNLRSFPKRFILYAKRYIKQVARDTWKVSVQQQVITFSITSVITILVHIKLGLITEALSWNSLLAVLIIIGIGFLIIILFNMVRAPFILTKEKRDTATLLSTPPAQREQPTHEPPASAARKLSQDAAQSIVSQLRAYQITGRRLLEASRNNSLFKVQIRHQWEEEVEKYIRENVGDSEANEFITDEPIIPLRNPIDTVLNARETNLINTRLERLSQIITRLQRS